MTSLPGLLSKPSSLAPQGVLEGNGWRWVID